MIRRSLATIAVAACLGLLLAACSADGEANGGGQDEVTLVLSSPSPSASHPDLHPWMEEITARTGGAVQFETFWDGSLCTTLETSSCITDGRADIGFHTSSYNPGDFPITEIGSLSFQTRDIQAQGLALNQLYDESEEMRAEFHAVNQHLLFFSPTGAHQIAATEPMTALDEFAGKSIRSAGGQSINLSALGANPVALAPAEVYESIERGVVDGASFPLELAANMAIGEVAPYFHDTAEWTGAMVILMWSMNLSTWESLDEEIQQIITEVSLETLDGIVEEHVVPALEKSCERVAEVGGEFVPIGDEADGEEWREAAEPEQVDQWMANASASLGEPEAFLERYQELLAENTSGEERTPGQICRDHLG